MPVIDLNSKNLWDRITSTLDARNEHVCVLPMTTFIKPVRTITVLQTDTSVTSTRTSRTAGPGGGVRACVSDFGWLAGCCRQATAMTPTSPTTSQRPCDSD